MLQKSQWVVGNHRRLLDIERRADGFFDAREMRGKCLAVQQSTFKLGDNFRRRVSPDRSQRLRKHIWMFLKLRPMQYFRRSDFFPQEASKLRGILGFDLPVGTL